MRASVLSVALLLGLPASAGTNEWTPLGPAGANVVSLAISPFHSSTIAAGTSSGYLGSTDGGATWRSVTTGYQTNAIAFDTGAPSIVYAATDGGLAKSTDLGAGYSLALSETSLTVLADPGPPATVFVGTYDNLYRSTDRGLTWKTLYSSSPAHFFMQAIAVDPTNRAVLYLGTQLGGMFKSTDGGATWSALAGIPQRSVYAIAVHPASPNVVFAFGDDGVYKSTNAGSTWSLSQHTSRAGHSFGGGLVVDPADPSWVYAAGANGVFSTADGGATWNVLASGLGSAQPQSLELDPSDHTRLYCGTSADGVFAMTVGSGGPPSVHVTSPNGGEQWVSGSVHAITWAASASIANVKLEYSTTSSWDPGDLTDPRLIAASVPNTGSYSWTVPNAMSSACRVKVSDAAGTTFDVSDGSFAITSCGSVFLGPPFSASLEAAGGSGSVSVNTMSGCPWSASSDVAWMAISSGWTGSGSGGFSYAVAPNLASSPREGTLRVGTETFSVTQAAGSSAVESVVFVPIVLDVHGLGGSHFTSELTLTNRSDHDASVRLAYTGASTLGGGTGSTTITLPAHRQIVESDAIAYLARLGVPVPASGNRGGTLTVGFRGISSVAEAAVTVRTTTAVVNGQAGLAYASVPLWKGLTATSYVCGLRENASDRSNVALQNAGSEGSVTLRVSVCSGDSSARVVLPDVTLAPGGFTQYSGILGANGMSAGYVKIERVSGTAPYYAYGVINDQANSDGSFVPPQPASTATVAGLTVPVVLEASVYTSELVVTNWSSRARTLRLCFVSDQVATSDRSSTVSLSIGAGAQAILPNVFQYFRDQAAPGISGTGIVGALFVTSTDGDVQGISIGARTSAPGGGGRYGLFYPAVPFGSGTGDFAWLYGLRQDANDRTNLAIVNTGESGSGDDVFAVDVYDGATGQLVHSETGIAVKARRWLQVNTVLAAYAPGVTAGYARVRRTSGTNPFLTYAVVNDGGVPQQRSDDGAFLASFE